METIAKSEFNFHAPEIQVLLETAIKILEQNEYLRDCYEKKDRITPEVLKDYGEKNVNWLIYWCALICMNGYYYAKEI